MMRPDLIRAVLAALQRIAWAALLVALPVTSFPFFPPAFGGEALVRPLSLYPLAILIVLSTLPRLFLRPIPRPLVSLLPFVLIAIASSLLSLLRGIEPALGVSVSARILRGLFTLLIGGSFYVTIALLPESIADLRFSLRWIYTGVGLAMAWGTLQATQLIERYPPFYQMLAKAQSYISIRKLHPERIAGLTYEPHWFAAQIILLVLPWSLAAVLYGYSAFRWRWRWLTVEWLLLGWAFVLLPFTYSRAGLVNLVLLVFLSVVLLAPRGKDTEQRTPGRSRRALLRPYKIVQLLGLALLVLAPAYVIGARNLFFARLWEYWQNRITYAGSASGEASASLIDYFSYLGLDARILYAQAAYRTYEEYPILGVGLGNYAFYFEEMLPYRPIAEVPEALAMITPEVGRDRLITAKNLYLRLLAETGIIGTAAFMAFVIAHLGSALYLWTAPQAEWKYWGAASLSGLIAFALSALTFDSFVIPNMWVVFGLIAAAVRVMIQDRVVVANQKSNASPPLDQPAQLG